MEQEDFNGEKVTLELLKQALESRLAQLDDQEKQLWAELNLVLGMRREASFWLDKLADAVQIEQMVRETPPENAVAVEFLGNKD